MGNNYLNLTAGVKDLDESMGPCEVNCPLRYLDMVPDPGGYATAWRAAVRAAVDTGRERAVLIRSLRLGQVVALVEGCKPARVTVAGLKPLTGYDDTGKLYKVAPRHIAAVEGGARLAL